MIFTVAIVSENMSVERLDALIRAELDRKRNPHNPQGKKIKSAHLPKANFGNGRGAFDNNGGRSGNGKDIKKKKGECHYCG